MTRVLLVTTVTCLLTGGLCLAQQQPDFTPQDLVTDSGSVVIERLHPDVSRPLIGINSFVALRAIVPSSRWPAPAMKIFNGAPPAAALNRPDVADFRDFQIERRERRIPGEFSEWQPVNLGPSKEVLKGCDGLQSEPASVSENMTDPVITMPLPARLTGEWNTTASHPRLIPDKDPTKPETGLLFRYLDFDVSPGVTYQYRVAVVVIDIPESRRNGREVTLTTDYSPPSPPVQVPVPWQQDKPDVESITLAVDAVQKNLAGLGDFHSHAISRPIGELGHIGPGVHSHDSTIDQNPGANDKQVSIETWVNWKQKSLQSRRKSVRVVTSAEGDDFSAHVAIEDFQFPEEREAKYLLEPIQPRAVGHQVVIRVPVKIGEISWTPLIDPRCPMHFAVADVLQRILSQVDAASFPRVDQALVGQRTMILAARPFRESREPGRSVVWLSYLDGIMESQGLRVYVHAVLHLDEAIGWNCAQLERRHFHPGPDGGEESRETVEFTYRRFADGWVCESATNAVEEWKLLSVEAWIPERTDPRNDTASFREGDVRLDGIRQGRFEWRNQEWTLMGSLTPGSLASPVLTIRKLDSGDNALTFELPARVRDTGN